jgi:DNA-binding response OmpR family regulator
MRGVHGRSLAQDAALVPEKSSEIALNWRWSMFAAQNGAMKGQKRRVVVIDDEESVRKMLEVALALEGFEVRGAGDGVEGLSLVRSWQPDCIVLDVMLPKVDGLTLVPMIRRLTEVPIIMLTARGEVRDRIDGIRAGADDYLPKPFDLEELATRLHAALRRPRLREVQRAAPMKTSRLDWRRAPCGGSRASSIFRRANSTCWPRSRAGRGASSRATN